MVTWADLTPTILDFAGIKEVAGPPAKPEPGEENPTDMLTYTYVVKANGKEHKFSVWGPEVLTDKPAYQILSRAIGKQGEKSVPVESGADEGEVPAGRNAPLIRLRP